jgi:hypothetical protein
MSGELFPDEQTRELLTFLDAAYRVDVAEWLLPDLHPGRREATELLAHFSAPAADRRLLSTTRDLLMRVDQIATAHEVSAAPSDSVVRAMRDAISPSFNANVQACIDCLRELGPELQSEQVRALVRTLAEHYEEVVKLERLLKGYIDRPWQQSD